MMRRFDAQLHELNEKLLEMAALAEKAIALLSSAIKNRDIKSADEVIELEADVDAKEKDVEAFCLRLLLQQQPVARDLRLITAALKMITDLERISDQAADISEIIILINGAPYICDPVHIIQMAVATEKMVNESIDAFVRKDLALARAVIAYDDVVDDLFDNVKHDLIALMRADNANGEQAIDLLMIAKYFERIGDHACNIAAWVVFSITGKKAK